MDSSFHDFAERWEENAQLAIDTIGMRPTRGGAVATFGFNAMQWNYLELLSANPPGSYPQDPVRVYRDFQRAAGVCFIDQWIPRNPLTMTEQGCAPGRAAGPTTGAKQVVCDGILIDSPEAVVHHLETIAFPAWKAWKQRQEADEIHEVEQRIAAEVEVQTLFGMNMLKGPYKGFFSFPGFLYGRYGYANYFMAYALYPEVIERGFKLHADAAEVHNRIAARAIVEGGLPRVVRLDHDMADANGTLVDVTSLERIWFPHFARAIKPLLDAEIRLVWHCDGNLMDMIPRLIACGIGGFQGFQYEHGMDYEAIAAMRTREGDGLLIIAGVSVTTTLPRGTPADVARQLRWLVDKGPPVGLMLGCSSSITPGVPRENLHALIQGLQYYRTHGRR